MIGKSSKNRRLKMKEGKRKELIEKYRKLKQKIDKEKIIR